MKGPATEWMKTQGLQHPFPTQLEHWKQPVAGGQCMQQTWPPHAFYPNHALFSFLSFFSKLGCLQHDKDFAIKSEVKTIIPDLIMLFFLFNGLICTRLVRFLVSASLRSSPPSPQDFYSLTECHIGKLAVRKAPPLFLRRWTSYKQEAVVVSAHSCYPNFTQGQCHQYKGRFF